MYLSLIAEIAEAEQVATLEEKDAMSRIKNWAAQISKEIQPSE